MRIRDFHNHLYFNRNIEGQFSATDGHTGMLPSFAKDLDYTVRETVHHFGLVRKAGGAIDRSEHIDDLLYSRVFPRTD